jgi:hypothetical protein
MGSGRKNVLLPHHALVDGSMAGNLVSAITSAQYQDNIGIQVKWASADAVGVITVEASINWNPHLQTGDWVSLTFDPVLTQPNSNNGSYLINLNQLPYVYYRVNYTRTSGSGTLNIWFSSKEI